MKLLEKLLELENSLNEDFDKYKHSARELRSFQGLLKIKKQEHKQNYVEYLKTMDGANENDPRRLKELVYRVEAQKLTNLMIMKIDRMLSQPPTSINVVGMYIFDLKSEIEGFEKNGVQDPIKLKYITGKIANNQRTLRAICGKRVALFAEHLEALSDLHTRAVVLREVHNV